MLVSHLVPDLQVCVAACAGRVYTAVGGKRVGLHGCQSVIRMPAFTLCRFVCVLVCAGPYEMSLV